MKYGSEKQIKWAEDIKASLTFDGVLDHPATKKAMEMILNIERATWWINNRERSGYDMIRAMLTGGLYVDGGLAEIVKDGSKITLTSRVIISDDRGGHVEDKIKVIKI